MSHNTIRVINNKVWGYEVSSYGLENGYLDYQTLAQMVGDCILNNSIINESGWDIVAGDYDRDIYQYNIISEYGYKVLYDYTDELVFYNHKFDMYLWGITHFGTAWSHVLTDIKLIREE